MLLNALKPLKTLRFTQVSTLSPVIRHHPLLWALRELLREKSRETTRAENVRMIAQVGCCDVISLQTYSIFVKTHLTDEKSKIFFENAAVAVFSFFHPFYKGIFVYQELKSYERTSEIGRAHV